MYSKEPALNNLYKSKAHRSLLNPCIFAKSLEMQFPKISKRFFFWIFLKLNPHHCLLLINILLSRSRGVELAA